MKLSCKVIEDMLPMYYDKVCSEDSAALVEEHLKDCPHCRQILLDLGTDIAIPEKKVDDIKPLKKIQKSYKKMRLRWLTAILIVLALIPAAFLGWNEFSARGIAFSNMDELSCAKSFMSALTEGDYEKAFSYWDIEAKKHEWLESDNFEEEDLVNFELDGLKKFCELGENNIEALGGIESFEYIGTSASYGVDYRGNKVYQIAYRIKFDGKEQPFLVDVSSNGICGLFDADGYLKNPLAQFCAWSEWLWQDYRGCYYDFDLKQYVYYDKNSNP